MYRDFRRVHFEGPAQELQEAVEASLAAALKAETGGAAGDDPILVERPEGSGIVTEIAIKVAITLLSKYGADVIDHIWGTHVWPYLQARFGTKLRAD